jgi:hypothetical protein
MISKTDEEKKQIYQGGDRVSDRGYFAANVQKAHLRRVEKDEVRKGVKSVEV